MSQIEGFVHVKCVVCLQTTTSLLRFDTFERSVVVSRYHELLHEEVYAVGQLDGSCVHARFVQLASKSMCAWLRGIALTLQQLCINSVSFRSFWRVSLHTNGDPNERKKGKKGKLNLEKKL